MCVRWRALLGKGGWREGDEDYYHNVWSFRSLPFIGESCVQILWVIMSAYVGPLVTLRGLGMSFLGSLGHRQYTPFPPHLAK